MQPIKEITINGLNWLKVSLTHWHTSMALGFLLFMALVTFLWLCKVN